MIKLIIFDDGDKWWMRDKNFHRTNGPAMVLVPWLPILQPIKFWYIDGIELYEDEHATINDPKYSS